MPISEKRRIEKFWEKVIGTDDPYGCWEWTGEIANGYGKMTINGKRVNAHRAVFLLGGTQLGSNHVHHRCSNKICVNPSHLQITTNSAHQILHSRWNEDTVIYAIQSFHRQFGRVPTTLDWNPWAATQRGQHGRAKMYQGHYGEWPSPSRVKTIFGSWRNGIVAAGFSPPALGRPPQKQRTSLEA